MEKVLPKGWVETNVKIVSEIIRGVSYKKEQAFPDNFDNSVYILRGGNIQDNKIDFDTDDNVYVGKQLINSIQLVKENDVVIVGSTGSKKLIGKAGIATHDLENVSFGAFLMLLRTKYINKKYHSYFFQTKYYRNSISELAGGVNINNIRKEYLENLIFPLPPLAEQERIVAKLDKLFAQYVKIKAALERIPQLLKTFRQQVLAQAVTGKLTEQWREGKDLDEWKKYTVREISDTRLGKMLDKAKNSGSEYPYLGNIDVQWNEINTDNLKRIRIDDAEFEKFKLVKGDVLVCEGGEAGRAAIWQKEDSNIIFQKALHRVRLYPKFLPEILLYNLELDTKSGRIAELYTGTTIKHLTGQNFAKYVVKYCSVTEQKQIVRRVESLFAKADAIESRYQALKAKIENLPQAILHKAFRGELVPQLPNDGDAKDLLAEIMALKRETQGKKRKN